MISKTRSSICMLSCSVLTSSPPPMVWSNWTLGPTIFAFIPAFSQIPCKYHTIQHRLQRLRLHQPAFTPITLITGPHKGWGANHDHARRGRSDAGAYIYIYIKQGSNNMYKVYIARNRRPCAKRTPASGAPPPFRGFSLAS